MERSVRRIQDILPLGASLKPTDRKIFVMNFSAMCEDDEIIDAINDETKKNPSGSITWNQIMITIHHVILADSKVSKTKASLSIQNNACLLILRVVKHAIANRDFLALRCSDVVGMTLQILESKVHKSCHETYISLLHSVINDKRYRLAIDGEQWQEIIGASLGIYSESSVNFKTILLEFMAMTVQYACLQSHLSLQINKILPTLESIYDEIGASKEELLKPISKLTCAVCQHIGAENRIALCKFSEKVLPKIIPRRSCPEKIDMLLMFVRIHHPGGAGTIEDGAYACDWEQWKNIVLGIRDSILVGMETKKLSPQLLNLACEVYGQIMGNLLDTKDEGYNCSYSQETQPHKRQRISLVIRNPIDMLRNPDLEVTWPMIQILTITLKKYPKLMKSGDYVSFLKIVADFVTASLNNEPVLDSLCELCTVLVTLEKEHLNEVDRPENVNDYWVKIWDTILRALSMNQNEVLGHKFLGRMIEKRQAPNPEAFIRLYVTNAIRWTDSSVKTLLKFCENMPMPDEISARGSKFDTSVRVSLLRWSLDIPWTKSSLVVPAVRVADLLTALTVRSWYKRHLHGSQQSIPQSEEEDEENSGGSLENDLFDDRERKIFADIERSNLSLIFGAEKLPREGSESKKSAKIEGKTKISTKFRVICSQEALDYLLPRLNTFIDSPAAPDDLENIVKKLTIFGKFISNFAEFKNVHSDCQMSKLLETFGKVFHEVSCLLATIDESKLLHLANVLEALEIVYSSVYHADVTEMMVKSTSMDCLKFVYHVSFQDVEESDEMSKSRNRRVKMKSNSRIRNSACKILAKFSCTRCPGGISEPQKKVMKNVLEANSIDSNSNSDPRAPLTMFQLFGTFSELLTSSELVDASKCIRVFYESRKKDEIAVRGVLRIIAKLYRAMEKAKIDPEHVSSILSSINNRLAKEKYGPLVYVDFVKCLARIICLEPAFVLATSADGESQPIMDLLVAHNKSPFYLVRLEVVSAWGKIFSSKSLEITEKMRLFKKIEATTQEIFRTTGNPAESVLEDELTTRTATVIQTYSAVINSNNLLQGQALYSLLKLTVGRGMIVPMVKRALVAIARNDPRFEGQKLIEKNLDYILTRWFEEDSQLQSFPWTLVDCESLEDFLLQHIETISAIKVRRGEFHHLTILCRNLGTSFEKMIESAFPVIMTVLMSMIVDENQEHEDLSNAKNLLRKLCENSDEFEQVKAFHDLLESNLSELMLALITRIKDEENFDRSFQRRVFFPSAKPPDLSVETIHRCFRLLEKLMANEKKHLIEYLVTERPGILEKIFSRLFCNILDIKSDREEEKLQAFHQYAFFGTFVLHELDKPFFDRMSLYVVRDTCYSLPTLIKDEALGEIASEYFFDFLQVAVPARTTQIKEILSITVSTLIPIVQASRSEILLKILRYLIIEQKNQLGSAIRKLDSFPNEKTFEELRFVHENLKYIDDRVRFSLEGEIAHFLDAINEKTLCCSHEGLINVRNQLSLRRNELREMYKNLEGMRGFAEDCATSKLHKLVHKLVQLTRSGDPEISQEAARCLGELGPADLTTMILHPENVYEKEAIDEATMLTFHAIEKLVDFLVEDDVDLRRASSEALYNIFSTPWGRELFDEKMLHEITVICKLEQRRLFDLVYPFGDRSGGKKSAQKMRIDSARWKMCINPENDSWIPFGANDSYSSWIKSLTHKILDCFVNFYDLRKVCRVSVEFCEILLPRLVNLIKQTDSRLLADVCRCINRFFGNLHEKLSENDLLASSASSSSGFLDNPTKGLPSYDCVRCMINIVNFMRIQSSDNSRVSLNYLHIAKAAQYCSAYFTSVLYAELWCETLLQETGLLQDKKPGSWISAIDVICEFYPEPGRLLQDIVREAYLHIGDPDSINGCGLSDLMDSSFRIHHYMHLRQWDNVLLSQDVELAAGNSSMRGILGALQHCGLRSLLGRVTDTLDRDVENVDDFMYANAWRLADWSLLEPQQPNSNQGSWENLFESSHYMALKSLHENDPVRLKIHLDASRSAVVNSLKKISLECSSTVYPILSRLQMLREIEDFSTCSPENLGDLVANWTLESFVDSHDFPWIEPILAQRLIMYRTKSKAYFDAHLLDSAFVQGHLEIAELAENQGHLPMASRALESLAKNDISSASRDRLMCQEAFLAWKRNDQDLGRFLVRNLIKKESLDSSLRAQALRHYGNWMAKTRSENPQSVIEKYYEESIRTSLKIVEKSEKDRKNLADTQADLAQFADSQYQQIITFMKSPQYESLVEASNAQANGNENAPMSARGKDEFKAMLTYQRQMTNDAAELEIINSQKDTYLVLAARYYLKTLQNADNHDLLVFRLVSLWLDNILHPELNDLLAQEIPSVASHKFVELLPQLAPHLSMEKNDFTEKIASLFERCAREHPHHALPVLFALKNTHKDHEFQATNPSRNPGKIKREQRVIAAEALIAKLSKTAIQRIIQETSDLSNALIALAYLPISDTKTKRKNRNKDCPDHKIPRNHSIMKIRDFGNICLPTITLEVRPDKNYEGIVGIQRYEENFDLPGGVNVPKKIVCLGSDGHRRIQLVKGQDDLRQDAVMQQVCKVVNNMLRTNKETKKRKLHIRTYKIVPLSQRSGILEWCENTSPISAILCDSQNSDGLHKKYYPGDWTVAKCRSKLQGVHKSPISEKFKAFLECCQNLHPAFHHFFMEQYLSPETWFERRLAYVRSVATTSMVGYMLGLGDRHFSNILIDRSTAEVIHIDFGIAFAQGKVLPMPETVPFRLTRDMEVAMGVCGVEGVMRRSCEETVKVLRNNSKILITLLEVLLYDPLFSWAITPIKSNEPESSNSRRSTAAKSETDDRGMKKTNKIAERALLRIEQKLHGTEDGVSSSVSGQVERLIQQARDPTNLCRLYSGWQAYL